MAKKGEEKKVELKAGGDEPMTDFDKHTGDVEDVADEGPSEDEPHGHPFQPMTAEPILVTPGGDRSEGRGQSTKSDRRDGRLVKISAAEAYDDPEFNPVAHADVPGHKGGPGAPDGEGTERAEGVVKSDVDENADKLDYNWKNEDEQPKE
jgi:hypothetical protein